MFIKNIKNYITLRIKILLINLKASVKMDTAYFWNNIGNLASTSFYIITYIFFIEVIFYNVNEFAGFNRNEVLFLSFVGQAFFYALNMAYKNSSSLSEYINSGQLDVFLTKPYPSLFYLSFLRIPIVSLLRDGLPNLFIIVLIDWPELGVELPHLILGLFTIISALVVADSIFFLFSFLAFFSEAKDPFTGTGLIILTEPHRIPFNAYEKIFDKSKFLYILVPVLIGATIPTSIMLGRVDGVFWFTVSVALAVLFMFLKVIFWRFCIKRYTSASS